MYKQEIKQKKINKQEQKTRYVVTSLINDMFFDHKLTLEQMPVGCHVDLCFTADGRTYDVEVKTRNKDIVKYPHVELKHSKLNNMKKDHRNNTLIYVVMVNDEIAYFWNLSNLDWDEIETTILHIKKVEYLEDSDYEDVLVYQLPLNKAVQAVNVTNYLSRYAILAERKKNNTIPKKKAC